MATNRTVTVKSSGGDYASLNAAFAGEVANLVLLDRQLTIECYNFEDTTTVSTAGQGWTTDATRYVLVKAVDDHGGKWSTSSYRLVTSNVACLTNSTIDHLHLQGLQFKPGAASGLTAIDFGSGLDAGWQKIEKCIVISDDTGSLLAYAVKFGDGSPTYYLWNNVFYCTSNTSSRALNHTVTSTPNIYVYNCTIDGYGYGVVIASGVTSMTNMVLKNTRITGTAIGVVYAPGGGTLNSASDYNLAESSAPTNWGSNSIDSTDTPTIDYVDDSNATLTSRDYHIGASDDGIGAGTDLSSDPNLSFSDDIDGESRG